VVFLIAASSAWLAQWLHCLEASAVNDLSNLVQMMRVAMSIFLGSAALSSCHPVPDYEKAVVLMLMVCDLNPVLTLTGPADWALISNFGVMWANTLLELWGGAQCPAQIANDSDHRMVGPHVVHHFRALRCLGVDGQF
jgi:hypothetical protein